MKKVPIEIIYEDDNLLAINKPSGISVTADRSGGEELLQILTEEGRGQLRLIHRLDKLTSGVMILAKNIETQGKYSSFFEKHLMKKTYLAIVGGIVGEKQGTINRPLARSKKNVQLMCVNSRTGKPAITKWKLLADFGGVALLAVQPVTGRTHQIRIHMKNFGLPLAIDPLYGGTRPIFLSDFKGDYRLAKDKIEKPLMDRLTLHAYQLEFAEKQDGLPNYFVAGLDKKFAATIKMLSRHNANGIEAFENAEDFDKIMASNSL